MAEKMNNLSVVCNNKTDSHKHKHQTKNANCMTAYISSFKSRQNQALLFRDVCFNDKTINKNKETTSPKDCVFLGGESKK